MNMPIEPSSTSPALVLQKSLLIKNVVDANFSSEKGQL